MIGKINSIETMGLVDGPGIRVVVFMQGCPLRCLYCHNPETWDINGKATTYTPKELIKYVKRYKEYFNNNGGITFSGGEPLMQKNFLLKCLKLCKKENIHTCIDTAGSISNCKDILEYTDLVILDIKATNNFMHLKITKKNNDEVLKFIKLCQEMNKKLWIRSVIIPGINDDDDFINELIDFLKQVKNIEKIELLPYHSLGVNKYEKLNIDYPLKNVKDMNICQCKNLEKKLKEGLKL